MKISFLKPKKKGEYFLVLDIGTEAVKAIIFSLSEKKDKKITILGNSLSYFDSYGLFDSQDFEADVVKKTISKTIKEAQEKVNQKPSEAEPSEAGDETKSQRPPNLTLLELPANILKGRIAFQSFKRKNSQSIIDKKEKEVIYQKILSKAQNEISQIFATESGILPKDVHFINLKILEIKIDGYVVPVLQGYDGKNLDFRILAIFLPKYYLENIKKIIQALIPTDFYRDKYIQEDFTKNEEGLEILHLAEALPYFFTRRVVDGIFLDVGGNLTQIFLVNNGKLNNVDEFEIGGKTFSQALSQSLGIEISEARVLKENYSKGELSEEVRKRVREIFSQSLGDWFKNLKLKLKTQSIFGRGRKSGGVLLPSTFFLFGGGSQLPEIQEILEEGNWEDFSFFTPPKVKFIYPNDLRNIEDITKKLNSPQDIPALLLCYASQIYD
ncbi:MAG: cell division FtsA domain-containing protein [Candidatus Nealsonbacteria bacterium]